MGKVKRRYAQLVQSYRPDDGLPAQRVVASLGALNDQELHNLKLALEASRLGKALLLPATSPWRPRVLDNLAYLDVAVPLSLWREWELSDYRGYIGPASCDHHYGISSRARTAIGSISWHRPGKMH